MPPCTSGASAPAPLFPDLARIARSAARRYRSAEHDHDDLTQEAHLALLHALPLYEPTRHGDLEAYLFRRVSAKLNRLCRQAGARQARRAEMPQDVAQPAREEGPAEVTPAMLACLTDQQRAVVELLLGGATVPQVAGRLGVTAGAVRQARLAAAARMRAAA